MALYSCPECGHMVECNQTTAGAFDLPPDIHCRHTNNEEYLMEVVG